MVGPTLAESNAALRNQLDFLIRASRPPALASSEDLAFDVVVTYNEINRRHGTGVLVQKLFRDWPNLLTIRSVDTYGGSQSFGEFNLRLPALGMSRALIFETVSSWLRTTTVKRVFCVPWAADDVVTAIAVKEITNAELCTYIMDDQNITKGQIPDGVMREALVKSRLRLVISPEMRSAYQNKYDLKFWLLPPVVDHRLLGSPPTAATNGSHRGVMVGNVWSVQWLKLLRGVLRPSGIPVDWYSNDGFAWAKADPEELKQDGINLLAGMPEHELAHTLSQYDFAVIPTGTLDETDDNRWVAQLSLPTKVLFLLAAAQTPLIVVGNPKTAAAGFVTRFGVGATCDYDTGGFQSAVRYVTTPENRQTMRERSIRLAPAFSDLGIGAWLRQALEHAEPPDLKFEELFAPQPGQLLQHVEPPIPENIHYAYHAIYQGLRRLKMAGFAPDFVIDVGASTGVWSFSMQPLFPDARFILVEALASRYHPNGPEGWLARCHPEFELIEIAISDKPGRMAFQVSSDLYNSSCVQVSTVSAVEEVIDVDVTTLDQLAIERRITGRGLLKIDVQYAEHLVIDGGRRFIEQNVDAIAIELTLERVHPGIKTFSEMINLMTTLGFRYFDDVGGWRTPATGLLEQKDVLFVRQGLF
jgi:FkbM family methyltransferase